MKFRIDHDLHIHSFLSDCSRDPNQTPEAILEYAARNRYAAVCLTDHYWDASVPGASNWYMPQDYAHISRSLPLPERENVRFLFGCETDLSGERRLGIPLSRFQDFDFVIIPTTHLHMTGFTISREDADNPARRSELWVERFDAVLDMDLPFHKIGIAHPACPLCGGKDYLSVLDGIPGAELERVFSKAASRGCGIELNAGDFRFSEADAETVLRIFRTAKGCGCRFYLGSDAHHPSGLDAAGPLFERAVSLLGLEEKDKYPIPC